MIQLLINFIIFIIILFFYIHINFHLSTSNDLEIYEIDELNKDRLEEICNIKQPLSFKLYNNELNTKLSIENIANNYGDFDINIRNVQDYSNNDNTIIPIKLTEGINLFKKDSSNNYISEYNQDFLNDTTLGKIISSNDLFLRPSLCSYYNYDLIFGSVNSYTPLKYELNYRNYFLVVDGEVDIMLTVPKNIKYLETIKDYSNFEFRFNYNPYDILKTKTLDKIKFLTITLKRNEIIYIPFKWIYTIKINQPDTLICSLRYRVGMNTLAIIPELFKKYLQNNNIKHKFLKNKKI
tara:strand:- start:8112 stop:8993 length:882 start_codon:yes stop_codon:yes gene_type:complete